MKKPALLIVLALFIQSNLSSQSCLPNGISFTSQTGIDNFQTNYPGCTEIEGDVTIQGDDISNLNGLSVVTSIGGDFWIGDYWGGNASLTNLTGLDNLTSIGGHLKIAGNDTLTNLTGLDNLTSIGGALWIGMDFIGTNPALTSLTGLDNLTSIGGYLTIFGNYALTSLGGLDNLTSIGESFTIYNNHAVTSLSGLDNMTFIGLHLTIDENYSLTSLAGLEDLTFIGGDLTITGNASLTNCEALGICDYLGDPPGSVTIYGNAEGCASLIEVALACDITMPCLGNGQYLLASQYDVDHFPAVFPECSEPGFDVRIDGDDITNLDSLGMITSIGGNLLIGGNYMGGNYNYALTSLTGLENLTSISGNLEIGANDTLTSLTGLDNLTSIGGNLLIGGNYALTSLTGLENLTSISGNLKIGYDFYNQWGDSEGRGNPSLISISGLDNLDSIGGDLQIHYNDALSTCEVQSICDYLASPNGTVSIYDNAPGCNSQEEVEEACLNTIVGERKGSRNYYFSPNPVNDIATFSSTEITSFELYNLMGALIVRRNGNTMDMSHLDPGMYFAVGFDKNGNPLYKGKVIKK